MRYSIAQIQNLMRQAGWPEDLIVPGAAVFYYESGRGNPQAALVTGAEASYGLAQVNTKAWPYTKEQLFDPLFNLQIAYQIYQQQGWRAWYNTYYGGRYQQYVAASQAAYNGPRSTDYITSANYMSEGTSSAGPASTSALLIVAGLALAYWWFSD